MSDTYERGVRMDLAGYVVNAVLVEGRQVNEVCAAHGVSRSWLYEVIGRSAAGRAGAGGRFEAATVFTDGNSPRPLVRVVEHEDPRHHHPRRQRLGRLPPPRGPARLSLITTVGRFATVEEAQVATDGAWRSR
jgi:hypothetical protein